MTGSLPARVVRQFRIPHLANRLLHASILGATFAGIRRRDPSVIVNGCLSLLFVSLPSYFERYHGASFRGWQRLWVSVAALVHTLGMLGPYDDIWWWDHLAHTLSGVVVAAAADLAHRSTAEGTARISIGSRPTFVAGVTVGFGILWEIFEYIVHALGDRFGFEPLLVHYGRLDAVGDIVFDGVGTLFVLLFGRHALSNVLDEDADREV